MIISCFSPDDSLFSWRAPPPSRFTTIFPLSDISISLLMKNSLTMSLKMTIDSARM